MNNASTKRLQKNLCPWREILRSGPCRPSGPVGHAPSVLLRAKAMLRYAGHRRRSPLLAELLPARLQAGVPAAGATRASWTRKEAALPGGRLQPPQGGPADRWVRVGVQDRTEGRAPSLARLDGPHLAAPTLRLPSCLTPRPGPTRLVDEAAARPPTPASRRFPSTDPSFHVSTEHSKCTTRSAMEKASEETSF